MQINRIPPQDIDLEEGILARCLMNDTEDALEHLTPDDFYRTGHKKIFKTVLDLVAKKQPVDLLSVTSAMRDKGELEEIGGAAYLAKLTDEVPLPVSIPHYAEKLLQKSILRKLIFLSHKIYQSAHETNVSADKILDTAQREILNIDSRKSCLISELKDLVCDANERYEELSKSKPEITGISSGYYALDKMTCGFQKSDLILLGARPSMGKTAFALNTASNAALMGHSVFIFSLEMAKNQLTDRIISSQSRVNGMKFKTGRFSLVDWERITDASSRIYEQPPIYIDDSSSLTYMEIIRRSRRAKKQHGIELIIIDYLQYVTGEKGQGKNYEIESITRNLKAMAKDLKIPVLLLSQLNRKCEERPNPYKRPVLSDLRDSGAIEQDADLVLFLYRPERYGELDERGNEQPGVAEINIAKHRNGPLGTVRLRWSERITRFDNPESKEG
jgi:replicative DNA helicase